MKTETVEDLIRYVRGINRVKQKDIKFGDFVKKLKVALKHNVRFRERLDSEGIEWERFNKNSYITMNPSGHYVWVSISNFVPGFYVRGIFVPGAPYEIALIDLKLNKLLLCAHD